MKYFVGTYTNKVDTKGRVSLPSAFRDVLEKTSATDFCAFPSPRTDYLEAGSEDLMDLIVNSMAENAPMFSEDEHILNYIMANARLISYDMTGRFVLPEELAQFAGISDKAVFVGSGWHFQIWQPDLYEKLFKGHREGFVKSGLKIKKPSQG